MQVRLGWITISLLLLSREYLWWLWDIYERNQIHFWLLQWSNKFVKKRGIEEVRHVGRFWPLSRSNNSRLSFAMLLCFGFSATAQSELEDVRRGYGKHPHPHPLLEIGALVHWAKWVLLLYLEHFLTMSLKYHQWVSAWVHDRYGWSMDGSKQPPDRQPRRNIITPSAASCALWCWYDRRFSSR
jgi:hypothetical protein